MLKNYKDLKVWQKSFELCLEIYRKTAKILVALIKFLENKPLNPWVTWQWLPVEREGARMRRSCPE